MLRSDRSLHQWDHCYWGILMRHSVRDVVYGMLSGAPECYSPLFHRGAERHKYHCQVRFMNIQRSSFSLLLFSCHPPWPSLYGIRRDSMCFQTRPNQPCLWSQTTGPQYLGPPFPCIVMFCMEIFSGTLVSLWVEFITNVIPCSSLPVPVRMLSCRHGFLRLWLPFAASWLYPIRGDHNYAKVFILLLLRDSFLTSFQASCLGFL